MMRTEPALCRYCGLRIVRSEIGWRHSATDNVRCDLSAKPVSAWGGRA